MTNTNLLDQAVVEAMLDAPARELRPRPRFYGPPQFAPAFFTRVRSIYARLLRPRGARVNCRSHWPAGHVIHMTLDHRDADQSYSVAACDCDWENRMPWPGHYADQDAAIEAHWCAIEAGASEQYGRGPGERGLDDLKAWNAFSPEERAYASARFVEARLFPEDSRTSERKSRIK